MISISGGYGRLVIPVVLLCGFSVLTVTTILAEDPRYFWGHAWTLGLSLVLSGGLNTSLEHWLRHRHIRTIDDSAVDPRNLRAGKYRSAEFENIKPLTTSPGSLYGIPMKWWSYILAGIGCLLIVFELIAITVNGNGGSAIPSNVSAGQNDSHLPQ